MAISDEMGGCVTYWVCCRRFCVKITVDDDDIIIDAAPIIRKFIGKSFTNLITWIHRFSYLKFVRIR